MRTEERERPFKALREHILALSDEIVRLENYAIINPARFEKDGLSERLGKLKKEIRLVAKEYESLKPKETTEEGAFTQIYRNLEIALTNVTEGAKDFQTTQVRYSHDVGKGLDAIIEKYKDLTKSHEKASKVYSETLLKGSAAASVLEAQLDADIERSSFEEKMRKLGQGGMVEFAKGIKGFDIGGVVGITSVSDLKDKQLDDFRAQYNEYVRYLQAEKEKLKPGEPEVNILSEDEFFSDRWYKLAQLNVGQYETLMAALTDAHMKMYKGIKSRNAGKEFASQLEEIGMKIRAWQGSKGDADLFDKLFKESTDIEKARKQINAFAEDTVVFNEIAARTAEHLKTLGETGVGVATTTEELVKQFVRLSSTLDDLGKKTEKARVSSSGMVGDFLSALDKMKTASGTHRFDVASWFGFEGKGATDRANTVLSGLDFVIQGYGNYVSQIMSMNEQLAASHAQAAQQALDRGRSEAQMYIQLADAVRYSNNEQAKMFEQKAIAAEETSRREYDAQQKAREQANIEAKKAFETQKRMQLAQILMSTATAIAGQLAAPPVGLWNIGLATAIGILGASQYKIASQQQFTPREKGGSITGGKPYLVGEAGPELIVPGRGGTVVNNDDLMNGMGGGDVIVNFNIQATDASGFDRLLVSRRGMIINMIRDATNSQMRRSPV